MRQPWTRCQIAVVVGAELVGVVVAFPLFVIAALALPPYGLFGVENDGGTRAGGALAAVGLAAVLPAGLWAAAGLRRSRGPAVAAAAVGAIVLAFAGLVGADGSGGWG